MNQWEKEILKQWIDVCATVVAGFMMACIVGYIAMNYITMDIATLIILIDVLILLGIFIFFVFPSLNNGESKEKGEST